MVLKKILLAFQPPGLGLVYTENNKDVIKHINLSDLTETTNTYDLTNKIICKENIVLSHWDRIHSALVKIQEKLIEQNKFRSNNAALVHFLPITNIAINNSGDKCTVGSYDRTAKIWDINTSTESVSLEGHNNVVFSVEFNKIGAKVLTGSFDKTAKLWDANSGLCEQTFWGHTAEVVLSKFLPGETIATASTDTTVRIFQSKTGQQINTFVGHKKDIISLEFDTEGKFIISGSFDKTIRIWDPRSGSCVNVLCGHEAEISSCKINKEATMLVSGSFDTKALLWDLRKMKHFKIFPTMSEVIDVDIKDTLIAACSENGTAHVWDYTNESQHWDLIGHEKLVSKIVFNPDDDEVMTCSDDHTVRIWNLLDQTKNYCLDHEDEVFTCVYSNCGNKIVSACKDNRCKVWFRY